MKETNVAAPKHILFTAPSNAAVDEVVIRLLARGIPTADGKVWCDCCSIGLDWTDWLEQASEDCATGS